MVKSVVGFNPQRGDLISVEALSIEPQTPPHETPVTPFIAFKQQQIYLLLGSLIGLMLITVGLYLRVRAKQRRRLLIELSQWMTEND